MGIYSQVQNILNGGVQIQKSDFSDCALSEKVERILKGEILAGEIEKSNPNHDSLGRFTYGRQLLALNTGTGGGGSSRATGVQNKRLNIANAAPLITGITPLIMTRQNYISVIGNEYKKIEKLAKNGIPCASLNVSVTKLNKTHEYKKQGKMRPFNEVVKHAPYIPFIVPVLKTGVCDRTLDRTMPDGSPSHEIIGRAEIVENGIKKRIGISVIVAEEKNKQVYTKISVFRLEDKNGVVKSLLIAAPCKNCPKKDLHKDFTNPKRRLIKSYPTSVLADTCHTSGGELNHRLDNDFQSSASNSNIPQSSEKSMTKSLYSQVQEILHGGASIQKSEFSQMPLSQKVDCILSKSYIPQDSEKVEKAGGKWGNLIPERKMNSVGRMVTYWVNPEDRNQGKMKGQQNLFGDDELKEQDEPEDSYYSKNDRDTEDYQIKPLVEKFKQYNPKLAERMAEKYKVYQWDRETRDLDLKLDFETLDYMRKAKNEPDYAKEYQEEYNERTDRTAKMLNNRKLAMARLKVGSPVKWNGHSGKITGFSRRGFPNVDFGGTTRTCFVEEIADIDELEKKFKAA